MRFQIRESAKSTATLFLRGVGVYLTAALILALVTVFCSLPPGLKPFGSSSNLYTIYALIAFANLVIVYFYGFVAAYASSQPRSGRARIKESLRLAFERYTSVLKSLGVVLAAFVISAVPMWFVLQLGVLEFFPNFPKHLVPTAHKMFSMVLAAFIAKEYMFMLPIAVGEGWGTPNPAHKSRALVSGQRGKAYLLCLGYGLASAGLMLVESAVNPEAHIRLSVWAATHMDYLVRIAFSFAGNVLSAVWIIFLTALSRQLKAPA